MSIKRKGISLLLTVCVCWGMTSAKEKPEPAALQQIGQLLLKAGNGGEALRYFKQSTDRADRQLDAKLIAMNALYSAMAVSLTAPEHLDSCFRQAIAGFHALPDSRGEYLGYHEYGLALYRGGHYEDAAAALLVALKGRQRLMLPQDAATTMAALGAVYHASGKLDAARLYLNRAAQRLDAQKYPDILADVYSGLYRIYLASGADGEAETYRHKLLLLEHRREQSRQAQANMKADWQETVERMELLQLLDRAAQREQANRYLFSAITALLVLLALLGGLLMRKRQQRKLHEAKLVQLDQQHALATARAIADMRDDERAALAAHLHDEVGALLAVVRLHVYRLDHRFSTEADKQLLASIQDGLEAVGATVRRISHGLMPPLLEKIGLKAAILEFLATLKATNALRLTPVVIGFEHTSGWDRAYVLALYRMVQELVANTVKHAAAKQLLVQLVELDDEVTLLVEDDGKGFSQAVAHAGIGLTLIRKQVEYYGGQLEIAGSESGGMSVMITLPIPMPA